LAALVFQGTEEPAVDLRLFPLVIVAALVVSPVRLSSQALDVSTNGGAVRLHAQGLHFIDGEALGRLKDGQAVRVDLGLIVMPRAGAAAAAADRQTCVLSYDLWEERFAATVPGAPPRSISHLTSAAVEGWCLQQLAVPLGALGALGKEAFWIRLEYRMANGGTPPPEEDGGFTLRGLVDALSRKPRDGGVSRSIEAGPFRVKP
jgi:hypothetical protein